MTLNFTNLHLTVFQGFVEPGPDPLFNHVWDFFREATGAYLDTQAVCR